LAHHKSAKKRIKTNAKRRLYNRSIKSRVKTYVRYFTESLEDAAKKTDRNEELRASVEEKLRTAISELQRSSGKGVLHQNTISRKASRLTLAFNKVFSK